MRIGDLGYSSFLENPDRQEFEIEDVNFFINMVYRIIEDMGVVTVISAKWQHKEVIDEETAQQAIQLINPEFQRNLAPSEAFIAPYIVRDLIRAPFPVDTNAVELLATFTNHYVINMLTLASSIAEEEGMNKIKLRHLLPACEDWPYPLNRFC